MKGIICAFLFASFSLSSFANCEALYQKRISDIQARLNLEGSIRACNQYQGIV